MIFPFGRADHDHRGYGHDPACIRAPVRCTQTAGARAVVTELPESALLDSLDPLGPPVTIAPARRGPRTLGFWGTALWGLFIIVAFFVGQLTPIGYFLLRHDGSLHSLADFQLELIQIASSSLTVSLSAIMGVPGLLIPAYFAVRYTRLPFVEYMGLRWTSWKNFVFGIVGM